MARAQESRAWCALMTLMSLSYCLLIVKHWLWKVLSEKGKRRKPDQNNKKISMQLGPVIFNRCFIRAFIGVNSITACDNIFGKGKWKSVQLPQHRSMSELWWVSGRRDEEETFELKIRKHSCGNYTERSVIVYMCWLWRESQARESAPMRVIFTRLQEQLSSRNLNSHSSTPLIGTLSRVCK